MNPASIDFFKKKWLNEHIAVMAFVAAVIICVFCLAIILKSLFMGYVLMLTFAYMKRNNEMMTYIQENAFDGLGNKQKENVNG